MAEQQPRPILITGAGRRIGLALAHHFLQQRQPVIVSYRTPYPAIDGLREAGALCLQADISDLIDYLFTSRYVTGRSFAVDGGRPLR